MEQFRVSIGDVKVLEEQIDDEVTYVTDDEPPQLAASTPLRPAVVFQRIGAYRGHASLPTDKNALSAG